MHKNKIIKNVKGKTTFKNDILNGTENTGNLEWRKKYLSSNRSTWIKEGFGYDNMDRLLTVGLSNNANTIPVNTLAMVYTPDGTGNIHTKTGIGEYAYDPNRVHAVTSVENTGGIISTVPQTIEYTTFNKVNHIEESPYTLDITYNIAHERITQVINNNGSLYQSKVYVGGMYEKITDASGTREVCYLSGPGGWFATYTTYADGHSETNYILKDHLGSVNYVLNEDGTVKQELSFDAWGNRRNPSTWQPFTGTPPEAVTDRGFTGHEHLYVFGLINMNGRVYDPILGRMLSPDNYVQAPDNTQNLNRYSYCMNNPLVFVDPDGNNPLLIPIIIGAIAGAYTGYQIAHAYGYDLGNIQTYGYMIGGAVIGGFSGYVGGAIAAGGGLMANTAGIIGSSAIYSMGMTPLSGGMIAPNISFGGASFNMGSGEFGYLGDPDNKWYENVGYGFGALANLQDVVAGVNGTSIDVKARPKIAGHSESDGSFNGEDITISVGPCEEVNPKIGGDLGWEWEYVRRSLKFDPAWGENQSYIRSNQPHITTRLNNINGKWLLSMTKRLNSNRNLLNSGPLKYGLFQGCVNYNARALLFAGVPTVNAFLPVTAPVLLNLELAIRQAGIFASPYRITH